MAHHGSQLPMTDANVRDRIAAFLLGEVSRADLEEWLTASTWDADAVTADTEVAFDAQLLLAEHARGDRDDAELEQEFRRLVVTARIGVAPIVATTANAVTERATWAQPRIVVAGTRLAGARA